MTDTTIQIGVLSPATPVRPHFKSLDAILPPGVVIAHEGLGLLGESYQDLAGKTERILELARSFVQRHRVCGVMITGGFVTLFNPGLEEKAVERLGLPVVSAVSSAVTALKAFGAKSILLMTPFDAASDALIQAHLSDRGFCCCARARVRKSQSRSGARSEPRRAFRDGSENFPRTPHRSNLFSGSNDGPGADPSASRGCLVRAGDHQQFGHAMESADQNRAQIFHPRLRPLVERVAGASLVCLRKVEIVVPRGK